MRWSAAALLVLALMGCSGGGDRPTAQPGAPATLPAPGTATLEPAKARSLQDVLAKVVAVPDSPSGSRGVTAAVVTDNWVWSGAAGADIRGTPLRPNTSIPVESITKTFVAAEILLLAQAKKLDLEAPLSTYVQHKLTANNATVRQHLSMTAGVQDFQSADYGELADAVAAAPSRHWTIDESLNYFTTAVKSPGGSPSFSNPSYALLAMLIEKVTGGPFAAALRRDLVAPAGLQHAAFQDGEKPQPPVVGDDNDSCGEPDGYVPCRAFASATAPYGGLAADAPTVARWGYQLYGGRVLPPGPTGELTKGTDYGLGTMLMARQFGLGTAYGHVGDGPDHSSLLVVIPEKRVSVALILADGGRNIGVPMAELTKALEPLLS
ncbi:serine hydrolase domain-containing protein [Kribbella jiaozuonensis]|uniref:Beta-lactamase family protein n=1 Tax=Kribbella jiaozuonensis TaxID=2575441 RepID=A0A4U3LU27_9ACTN|nr:serine hydrolase domain-containing protein [Kribbella jiaozuonensis]TKK79598.1 beta-lactamase family protein [Kribbella jiaozuonensis]